MLSSLESGIGLDVVLWLQGQSNGLFDILAQVLHLLGLPEFFIPALVLVYWSLDRRLGIRLLFALAIALLISTGLKEMFQRPRPFSVSDAVVPLVDQAGYGLPSGHVAIALAVWGYAVYWYRLWRALVPLGVYVLLVSWSRMYLGVHYPQDVAVGLVLGGLTLWSYIWLAEHFPTFWKRLALQPQVALVVLVTLVSFVFLFQDEAGQALSGVLLGSGLGLIMEGRWINFRADGTIRQRALRYGAGVALTLLLFFGLRALFEGLEPQALLRALRYGLVAWIATFGWPWLAIRLGWMEQAASREIAKTL